jgi:hypothetical protein
MGDVRKSAKLVQDADKKGIDEATTRCTKAVCLRSVRAKRATNRASS